jgi:uncharacterized protein
LLLTTSCLIIFTRYPEPGKTKTRLIPALGENGAAQLHRRMAEHTVQQALALSCHIEVWYVGGSEELMQNWLGTDLLYREQPIGDLGDRMCAAFRSAFEQSYQSVMIVGTDCPGLTTALLIEGFAALQSQVVTIGPAIDGGYYLIGLRCLVPELFKGISWSTAMVLKETLQVADRLNLDFKLLPYLHDIDIPEDLKYLAPNKASCELE